MRLANIASVLRDAKGLFIRMGVRVGIEARLKADRAIAPGELEELRIADFILAKNVL